MSTIRGMSSLELELEEDSELAPWSDAADRAALGSRLGEAEDEISSSEASNDAELEDDRELTDDGELDDAELEDDSELDDAELEDDSELDDAELEDDSELESDAGLVISAAADPHERRLAKRLYELSLRTGESELEQSYEVDRVLREMEREYFIKGLLKAGKGALQRVGKRIGKALPKGLTKLAAGLAGGQLRGILGSVVNTALSAASQHPALAAAMPALKALGFGGGAAGRAGGAASGAAPPVPWENVAALIKDSFSKLAQGVATGADQEIASTEGAQRAAQRAFRGALKGVTQRQAVRAGRSGGRGGSRARVVTLRQGERLIVRVR
jgi:hypothetical protein